MNFNFEKSEALINHLGAWSRLSTNDEFFHKKMEVILLLLRYRNNECIDEYHDKDLIERIKSNPLPTIDDIQNEFYEKCSSVVDVPIMLFRTFSSIWENKLPRTTLSFIYDPEIKTLYANISIINYEVEEMFMKLSNIVKEDIPDLYIKDDIAEIVKSLNNRGVCNNTLSTKHPESNGKTKYEINHDKVMQYVYDILKNDAFVLSKAQFNILVENADFSSVYGTKTGNKAKIKWMIACLSASMGYEWYNSAARSINAKPQECSGANVAEYIKNKLNKDKIETIINERQ